MEWILNWKKNFENKILTKKNEKSWNFMKCEINKHCTTEQCGFVCHGGHVKHM